VTRGRGGGGARVAAGQGRALARLGGGLPVVAGPPFLGCWLVLGVPVPGVV
jgi:hypothetical protein